LSTSSRFIYPKPSDVVEPWRWIALSQFRLPLFSSPEKKGIPAAFCYSNFESFAREGRNQTPRQRNGISTPERGEGRERKKAMVGSRDAAIGGKEISVHFLYLLVSLPRPARKLGERITDDRLGW